MAKIDWFEIWREDKKSMIATMIRNMASDLEAGYDYHGECIQRQKREIAEYEKNFNVLLDFVSLMEPNKVQHWCYCQLLKSGAIC